MPAPRGTVVRHDWQDTLRAATDIALLGIVAALAALPLVTAGAAAITASRAVHHWCEHSELPALGAAAGWFRRAVLPGLCGLLAISMIGGALVVDAVLIDSGRVPGGAGALALTLGVAWIVVGVAAVALVRIGQRPVRLREAVRAAVPVTGRGWIAVLAAGGVVGFSLVLGTLIPVTVPLLPGVTLLALHTLVRRLLPQPAELLP